jgi:hypothetical protein
VVEQNGETSNFLAFEEMARWGAMIGEIRSFPSYYSLDAK